MEHGETAQDESKDISSRSWSRAVEGIAKNGYKEGSNDGRASTFQHSFDLGYEEGLRYGINIGFHRALKRVHLNVEDEDVISMNDPQKLNCQVCQNKDLLQQHVINVDNIQKENNTKKITDVREMHKDILEEMTMFYSHDQHDEESFSSV